MGSDQEVVKRSGRDEPVWVAIYKCMEATRGISLYSSLFQTSKTLYLSYHLLCFLFNKIREQKGGIGKNDKIKKGKCGFYIQWSISQP
jgi:hypothetical protein